MQEKKKFLVIFYDADQQQALLDFIVAPDEAQAVEICGEIRGDYSDFVIAFSLEELRQLLADFTNAVFNDILSEQVKLLADTPKRV